MSAGSGLAAFLTGRLDEDERVARALMTACRDLGRAPDFTFRGGPAAGTYWRHFSEDRAIREGEAGRRILARHQQDPAHGCCTWCTFPERIVPWPCPDLRDLLYWWSDHPDYDPEWRPTP